jgi:hypothetical protein
MGIVVALAEELDQLVRTITEKEAELSELKARKDLLTFVKLPEAMDEEGVQSLRLTSGRGVTRSEDVQVSVLAEDRERQQEWLRDMGAESLIQSTVNHQSFQSFVKERIEAMQEIPEFVKLYCRPRVRFVAARR